MASLWPFKGRVVGGRGINITKMIAKPGSVGTSEQATTSAVQTSATLVAFNHELHW